MLNDAEVQGLGVISGKGLECVITLGTGMGFSLFENGRPAPHLELSQHPDAQGQDLRPVHRHRGVQGGGQGTLEPQAAARAVGHYHTGWLRHLYIGGGNAKQVDIPLPANVQIVGNEAGITGGAKLWDQKLDALFAGGG